MIRELITGETISLCTILLVVFVSKGCLYVLAFLHNQKHGKIGTEKRLPQKVI